jgi:hypothetical protein
MTDRGQGGSGCSRGTTAEKVDGAGLGLVLSHKLSELHGRVFSAYELLDGTRIWIITETDRSVTTILLPEEY